MRKKGGLSLLLIVAMTVAMAGPAMAQAAGANDTPREAPPRIVDLGAVVVSGAQPGPGLWKVTRGEHVLWVLGTLSPLPRRMAWEAARVEQVIAQSQEVLLSPSVTVKAGGGFFGKLTLIPSALKARRNPDGRRLQDMVDPAAYARWQRLKATYLGSDRGIERWRPVFAALELYDKAIRRNDMTMRNVVGARVETLAKQHGVTVTNPQLVIPIPQPKQALKEFAQTSLDDRACFDKTLDRLESDLGTMAARANAWAIGDLQTLRELPYGNQFTACSAAFSSAALARKYGVADMAQQMERKWLAAVEAALARNRTTFALLPMSQLLKADGYLATLQAQGYRVEAP